jgi:hypothetical protein
MSERDEIVRLREAFAAFDAEAGECPAPEKIWDGVAGKLPSAELRALLDHVATCATCAEDWRLAVAFEEESSAAEVPMGQVIQGRFNWRPLGPVIAALAAGLFFAIVGLQVGPWSGKDDAPIYREGEQAGLESLVPAGKALPRESFAVRWSPVPGATSYEVLVSTEDLKVLSSADNLRGTEYHVPAADLAGLIAGTPILWQVKANFADGSSRSSATFETPVR